MKYIDDFCDERLKNGCVYCHDIAKTRDHIPSKVFLDKPYPPNLFVVPACEKCNNSFSKDEAYVAFLIEYLKSMECGNPCIARKRLEKLSKRFPTLDDRILKSIKQVNGTQIVFEPENDRIYNVVRKHAFGHVCYELGESIYRKPNHCSFQPVNTLSESQVNNFNSVIDSPTLPEVGSRLMQRIVSEGNSWVDIQEENYRYFIACDSNILVRMVFREFLYCEVIWEDE